MNKVMKRLVATMVAAVTIAAPATALADEEAPKCSTYDQVSSNSTGGDYVGGILMYESTESITRNDPTVTTTTSTTGTAGIPGTGTSVTTTTTTTTLGESRTTQEPIGYYSMNDGSIWVINCITGEANKVSG